MRERLFASGVYVDDVAPVMAVPSAYHWYEIEPRPSPSARTEVSKATVLTADEVIVRNPFPSPYWSVILIK